ncbi:MAG TPA: glycosyltransferase family 2 protein [Bacillota bacterium]
MRVSAIIPAYNEAARIGHTVSALARAAVADEIIVVDDGSRDDTAAVAKGAGARVVGLARNQGKAAAVRRGFAEASGEAILLLDADLGATARAAGRLLDALAEADLVIGCLPGGPRRGGVGAVVGLARWAMARNGGGWIRAPLSGQRACRRRLLDSLPHWGSGFGLEVAMTLHALRCGARIVEVDVAAEHRVTGFDWPGFAHRARQFRDIARTLWLWRRAGAGAVDPRGGPRTWMD